MTSPAPPAGDADSATLVPRLAPRVSPLLFGSGLCALVYQVAWLREFRLVFGASTEASAAVLAIFIGGLGIGGLLLGPRADRSPAPLAFYARLEAGIALAAAATPALLWGVRAAYVSIGGGSVLGPAGGTVFRLVLAALVLALPTVLMGGTLPAAARAVETEEDRGRLGVALLYGVNTLGAVAGSFLATFFMFEAFGTRRTLWLAALLNLLVAILARALARGLPPATAPAPRGPAPGRPAPAWFVLGAAAWVGFAFFLMELVWYRMLAPLLGGTVFTFGLILSVALLGIGLGGASYSLLAGRSGPRSEQGPTLAGFAMTCLLEAACLALPFAAGDRIAVLALLLRPLGSAGFGGHVLAWTAITGLVVLPAAFVAGVQFPLLIALLGRGRENVGREVGLAYAWNTAGSIAGSIAGGFGLLPALSAPGCWRAAAAALTALGLAAAALARGVERRPWSALAPPGLLALTTLALLLATGPTAAWRHSGIGAGRASLGPLTTPNGIRVWREEEQRVLRWETDGVESSVAIEARGPGLAFLINGKIDGNSIGDAPTQIMSGLLGAILHPAPRGVLVIGLGTGSTAGWLGAIPGIERVDVVELERGVLEVARACAAVNRDVLRNPKVHVRIGDGREVLLATPTRYDIVFSEPSNPYRAGIASLFTREYYHAAAQRLRPGGLFVQWMQAYEVDGPNVRRIYATLQSVFPFVESWRTDRRNLLLVASARSIAHPVPALRERLRQEPYRTALLDAWRSVDLEGFLGHFVAGPELARAIALLERGDLNTDDRNPVEFGFAESVGRPGLFQMDDLVRAARTLRLDRPAVRGGEVDWGRVEDERLRLDYGLGADDRADLDAGQRARARAFREYLLGNLPGALAVWRGQEREPIEPMDLVLLADALAEVADPSAERYIEALRALQPAEADGVLARLRLRQGRFEEAAAAAESAFLRCRTDPWPWTVVIDRTIGVAEEVAWRAPELAPRLLASLDRPFAVLALDESRAMTALQIAWRLPSPACVSALAPLEPHVPWQLDVLEPRARCYAAARDPRAARAARDLADFLSAEPAPFLRDDAAPGP